jgi:dethiobiotin synthetase
MNCSVVIVLGIALSMINSTALSAQRVELNGVAIIPTRLKGRLN